MVQAVSFATAAPKTTVKTTNHVTEPVELKTGGRKGQKYQSVEEKQNDNILLELNYIGSQLKTLLDIKAGKEVKVEKYSNKLPEDKFKTNVEKQKDDAIVELGYIGDVLKKMVDVNAGKEVEPKPKKQAERV
ncbi:hypothetical protein IJ843_08350 [bacterium]|nr:hypothetical protein [bacterium]